MRNFSDNRVGFKVPHSVIFSTLTGILSLLARHVEPETHRNDPFEGYNDMTLQPYATKRLGLNRIEALDRDGLLNRKRRLYRHKRSWISGP